MLAAWTTKSIRQFTLDEIFETVSLTAKALSELSRCHGLIQSSPRLWPIYRSIFNMTEEVLKSIKLMVRYMLRSDNTIKLFNGLFYLTA